MSDRPGLPLTTGEGNTAQERLVSLGAQMNAALDAWQAERADFLAECGRLREREQAAHGEGYDQGVEDVWGAPVCSVCGANHDADESAMCAGGEVVSCREWVDAAGRLREQLDAARPDDIAKFLRARAQSLVEGFYPDWQHVEWLRESADTLEAAARAALGVGDE